LPQGAFKGEFLSKESIGTPRISRVEIKECKLIPDEWLTDANQLLEMIPIQVVDSVKLKLSQSSGRLANRLATGGLLSFVVLALLCGCQTARMVDPTVISKQEGFIADGKTTKKEVQDRFGPAQSVYEQGTILVYHVNLDDHGRISLRQNKNSSCDAYVLVFDDHDLLERHSLVKNGCR
jgi:hypothetical protein